MYIRYLYRTSDFNGVDSGLLLITVQLAQRLMTLASHHCHTSSIHGVDTWDGLWLPGPKGGLSPGYPVPLPPTVKPQKRLDLYQREWSFISCCNMYYNRCKINKVYCFLYYHYITIQWNWMWLNTRLYSSTKWRYLLNKIQLHVR